MQTAYWAITRTVTCRSSPELNVVYNRSTTNLSFQEHDSFRLLVCMRWERGNVYVRNNT